MPCYRFYRHQSMYHEENWRMIENNSLPKPDTVVNAAIPGKFRVILKKKETLSYTCR